VNNYKERLGECYLANNKLEEALEIFKELAEEAKQVFLWIKMHSPADMEVGRIEHFEAVIKIAECYDVMEMLEAAKRVIVDELKHGTYPFPAKGDYKNKLKTLIKEYDQKLKKAPETGKKPAEKTEKKEKKVEKTEQKGKQNVKKSKEKEKAGAPK
jgi:tetratricopeptide (TPR) repeat protein